MRFFFGCVLAALAGTGMVDVMHRELYDHPEWYLTAHVI